MKQGGLKAVSLVLIFLSLTGAILYADEKSVNLESVIIQNFDEPDAQPWFAVGSKFHTEGYPKTVFYQTVPIALRNQFKADAKPMVLGVAMMFDRKENNYVDIIPGTMKYDSENNPDPDVKEIPLPGRIQYLDLWVWSGNLNYQLEAYVRDYKGLVHILPLGGLNFDGWRNLRVEVPKNIPQSRKQVPKLTGLSLVKFRIWTGTKEIVAQMPDPNQPDKATPIYVYLDQVKVLTDTYESMFDGDDLSRPEIVQEAWGSSSESGR